MIRLQSAEELVTSVREVPINLFGDSEFGKKRQVGLTVRNTDDGDGVVVHRILSGSAAAVAGVQPGDIIMKVNKKSVSTHEECAAAITEVMNSKRTIRLTCSAQEQQSGDHTPSLLSATPAKTNALRAA